MSDSNTGQVLCATTTTIAGCAVLPNTGNDPLLTVFSYVAIAVGAIVLASFVGTRLSAMLSR